MIKKLCAILSIILLVIPSISAIRINEVELNPEDGTSGKEWIELYNNEDSEIDISGWEVYDGLKNPKKRYTIPENTIIKKEEYYIIELKSAVLNNAGDFVTLYDSQGEKIDEIKTLEELSWGSQTWQFCDEWIFAEQTKGEENDCEEEQQVEEQESEETPEELVELSEKEEPQEEIENFETIDIKEEVKPKNTELEMIKLNPQTIKGEGDNENLSKNNYPMYGFVIFCIVLGFLFTLRKNRFNKNEFR